MSGTEVQDQGQIVALPFRVEKLRQVEMEKHCVLMMP